MIIDLNVILWKNSENNMYVCVTVIICIIQGNCHQLLVLMRYVWYVLSIWRQSSSSVGIDVYACICICMFELSSQTNVLDAARSYSTRTKSNCKISNNEQRLSPIGISNIEIRNRNVFFFQCKTLFFKVIADILTTIQTKYKKTKTNTITYCISYE